MLDLSNQSIFSLLNKTLIKTFLYFKGLFYFNTINSKGVDLKIIIKTIIINI